MAFLKIMSRSLDVRDKSEIWNRNSKNYRPTPNRNTEHEETFKDNLKTTYDELAQRKDTINYYDFSYSLLKDGGVKAKIIKYLPLINQQVNNIFNWRTFT